MTNAEKDFVLVAGVNLEVKESNFAVIALEIIAMAVNYWRELWITSVPSVSHMLARV